MEFLIFISIFGGGIFTGYLLKKLFDKVSNKVNNLKEIKEKNDQYDIVYKNIINKKSRFKTRVNSAVYIGTKLPDYGRVNIVYLLDKNDVVIFKDEKCIMTSEFVEKSLLENIIKEIVNRHGYRIYDVVEVFGLVFYRPDFEERFNVNFEDIRERMSSIDLSEIDKIKGVNKIKFDMDEILDKISKVGIENLSIEEKEFLNNFNKD
jgi:hypothetical protein